MVTSLLTKTLSAPSSLFPLGLFKSRDMYHDISGKLPEMVFIDPSLPDYAHIVANMKPDTLIHPLDPEQDSLQQIRTILEKSDPVSAVHVYSQAGQFTFY
ncbi:MAG: DUF4347 domain-containing protein [Magnetococcales bacterium]|nr:DUF4347 domain-containing protein [Magnetococcales bacterium]MBF0115956.1 DUF4347 domain-containing protein [Magnetococcales bacterium]